MRAPNKLPNDCMRKLTAHKQLQKRGGMGAASEYVSGGSGKILSEYGSGNYAGRPGVTVAPRHGPTVSQTYCFPYFFGLGISHALVDEVSDDSYGKAHKRLRLAPQSLAGVPISIAKAIAASAPNISAWEAERACRRKMHRYPQTLLCHCPLT